MIFRPELARAILRGKKTQTRRPMKVYVDPVDPYRYVKGKRVRRAVPPTIDIGGTRYVYRYQPGSSYAVQPGRGKEAICRLKVSTVERSPLQAITQRDAIAEGFKTTAQFADYWMRMYDQRWAADRKDVGLGDDDDAVLARFAERCVLDVWVITFDLDISEQPLYLRALMGSVSDYTENPQQAVKGELPAVPRDYQQILTREARARDEALAKDMFIAERRTIEASIRTLEDHLGGPHVARRLELMRRELAAIDRDLKAAA